MYRDVRSTVDSSPGSRLSGDLSRWVAGVDVGLLGWQRSVSLDAVALALIDNVRAGPGPLGDHPDCASLHAQLDQTDYPERCSDEDRRLARRLARLSGRHEQDMVAILDRHGLAGLTSGPGGAA